MMRHWVADLDADLLPNWREAMPAARPVRRDGLAADLAAAAPDMLWLRLRAGEDVATVLAALRPAPRCPLVVLGDVPDDAFCSAALAAGAAGCCNSRAAPEVLRQVALVVGNGGLCVGQSLLQRLIGGVSRQAGERRASADGALADLSERETQVARLVAAGASNKEIAQQLAITERTVKAHLTAIFDKLGLRDRLQLSLRVNGLEG